MGPYLVTPDEVPDPYALTLTGGINGRELQRARAGEMHFRIGPTLAYLSRHMTLEPGDVVSMGTPGGIGSAREPRVLIRPGDTVEAGIGLLGSQRCRAIRA
jgi:2-keto-4-pentenoate hydratase/2-oxohepta-3-ene-1,7-dioic acid hydratase in catechol pathway